MPHLVLDLPDDLADAVAPTRDGLAAELRLMASLKLFELGKLSSGKSAELAGLSRAEFLEACSRYRVPAFNYPDGEIAAELHADLDALGDLPR